MEKNIDDRREPELHVGAALNAVEAAMSGTHGYLALALSAGNPLADVMTGAKAAHHVYEAWWRVERSFECVKTPFAMPGDPQTIALLEAARDHLGKLCACFPKTEMARGALTELSKAVQSAKYALEKTEAALATLSRAQKIERMREPGKE
jgi:hypothetical protein